MNKTSFNKPLAELKSVWAHPRLAGTTRDGVEAALRLAESVGLADLHCRWGASTLNGNGFRGAAYDPPEFGSDGVAAFARGLTPEHLNAMVAVARETTNARRRLGVRKREVEALPPLHEGVLAIARERGGSSGAAWQTAAQTLSDELLGLRLCERFDAPFTRTHVRVIGCRGATPTLRALFAQLTADEYGLLWEARRFCAKAERGDLAPPARLTPEERISKHQARLDKMETGKIPAGIDEPVSVVRERARVEGTEKSVQSAIDTGGKDRYTTHSGRVQNRGGKRGVLMNGLRLKSVAEAYAYWAMLNDPGNAAVEHNDCPIDNRAETLPYEFGGETHRWRYDFRVRKVDGSFERVEIKSSTPNAQRDLEEFLGRVGKADAMFQAHPGVKWVNAKKDRQKFLRAQDAGELTVKESSLPAVRWVVEIGADPSATGYRNKVCREVNGLLGKDWVDEPTRVWGASALRRARRDGAANLVSETSDHRKREALRCVERVLIALRKQEPTPGQLRRGSPLVGRVHAVAERMAEAGNDAWRPLAATRAQAVADIESKYDFGGRLTFAMILHMGNAAERKSGARVRATATPDEVDTLKAAVSLVQVAEAHLRRRAVDPAYIIPNPPKPSLARHFAERRRSLPAPDTTDRPVGGGMSALIKEQPAG